MAGTALRALPAEFREHVTDVVVKVEEFATREEFESVGLDNRWDLTRLY